MGNKVLYGQKLNLDTKEDKGLVYLLNGQMLDKSNNMNDFVVQNSPSNSLCFQYPQGFELRGIISLPNDEQVFFFEDTISKSYEIGKLVNCTYFKLVNAKCLNFTSRIHGVFKYYNNKRRIYWTDNVNPPRYLDIDNGYPKVKTSTCEDCEPTYSNELDCSRLKIWRDVEYPNCEIEETTGNLPNGTYQVAIAYQESGIRWSDYYIYPKLLKLHSNTGKRFGIKMTLDCLSYMNSKDLYSSGLEEFEVILISHRADRGFTSQRVGVYDISTKEIIINEIPETGLVIDSGTLLSRRPVYQQAKLVTNVSDYLVFGGMTERKQIDYRPQANAITSQWVTLKVKKQDAHKYPSYMRGEVYAHYIRWIYKDGERTDWTHIPVNTESQEFWFNSVENDDVWIDNCVEESKLHWQIYDTCHTTFAGFDDCFDCIERQGITGRFGYWESNEKYSDDYPDLACTGIKYHKFPANRRTHIHDAKLCSDGVPVDPCINILTVQFGNIMYPKDSSGNYIPNVVGYEIGVAERDKSILHKGLLFNMAIEEKNDLTHYYQNYPYNDLSYDRFLATELERQGDGDGIDHVSGDVFRYDRYSYNSPDIHFIRGEGGTEFELLTEEVAWINIKYDWTYGMPKYQILSAHANNPLTSWSIDWTLRPIQYAVQMNSNGYYHEFNTGKIVQGNIRRRIEYNQYMLPVRQSMDNIKINNWHRESAIYIRFNTPIQAPYQTDYSRVRLTDVSCHTEVGYCSGLGMRGVSYYGAVKLDKPNQYGQLGSHQIRQVTNVLKTVSTPWVYGGDVYISRFQFTKKFPFFTQLPIDLPLNTAWDCSEYMNVQYPVYWQSTEDQGFIKDLLSSGPGTPKEYYLDDSLQLKGGCTESDPDWGDADYWSTPTVNGHRYNPNQLQGVYYTHAAALLNFFVESEFIHDFREIDEVYDWTQDQELLLRRDTLDNPEKFLYDLSFLSMGISQYTSVYKANKKYSDKFRVITSIKSDPLSGSDNWLVFRANDFIQFSEDHGQITKLQDTDFGNLLIAFENAMFLTQAGEGLLLQNDNIVIGQGDIFTRGMLRLSYADSGYSGCIDQFSFVNTKAGTFWCDRKRKKMFKFDSSLHEITGNLQSWFNEYMASDIEAGYDPYTENVYFSCKDWTISYNLMTEDWVSFHSFIPKQFVTLENNMATSDSKGYWKHNTKYHYQTYYNKFYPFEVGTLINSEFKAEAINSMVVVSEFIKEYGYNNKEWKDLFFDKMMVWNKAGTTGIVDLYLKDKSNPQDHLVQVNTNQTEVTKVEDCTYKINKFENKIQSQPVIKMNSMLYNSIGVGNKPFKGTMRGTDFNIHFINSKVDDIKILFPLVVTLNKDIIQ